MTDHLDTKAVERLLYEAEHWADPPGNIGPETVLSEMTPAFRALSAERDRLAKALRDTVAYIDKGHVEMARNIASQATR